MAIELTRRLFPDMREQTDRESPRGTHIRMETMYFHIGLSPWFFAQGLLHGSPGTVVQGDEAWRFWPFQAPGLDAPFLPIAAKVLFLLLVLGGIALLLRRLFGPGGPLREPWMTATQGKKSPEPGDRREDDNSVDREEK